MVVTRATIDDIKEIVGDRVPNMPSMVSWCGKVDGKVIAAGGYFRLQGRWHAYSEFKEEALEYKFEIGFWAMRALQHARKSGIRYLYAELDSTHPGASAWLQRLGFHLDPRTMYYFRWKA